MTVRIGAPAAALAVILSSAAQAFIPDSATPTPWLTTASGTRVRNGDPATITWSIVPDGTATEYDEFTTATKPSDLVAFMNANFDGDPAQTDLSLQPWFHLFEESFGRWSQLSGVNYVYQPQDDASHHPGLDGLLGVRGDVRLSGLGVDGADGTLAFTYLPGDGGDMVVDTDDVAYLADPTNNYRAFRNTLTHEIGHSFGLDHVESGEVLLMNPFSDDSIDGPQLDDVRGVQYYFGDAKEKAGGAAGNGTTATATPLGLVASGSTAAIGAGANLPNQAVAATATDFVSIARSADVDVFSFSVAGRSLVTATLTPRGGVFTQAEENANPTSFNANNRNNLALSLLGTNGTTTLAATNSAAAGAVETAAGVKLPAAGLYYARVTGAENNVQLYQLSLAVTAILDGDFNENGAVSAADLAAWRTGFATSSGATHAMGDADGDAVVDGFDLLRWQQDLGASPAVVAGAAVPEPATAALAIFGLIALRRRGTRYRIPARSRHATSRSPRTYSRPPTSAGVVSSAALRSR
jgi:hypothetical protein